MEFFGIFPTTHIDVCIEQTSIWAVSGSHRSTAHINGTLLEILDIYSKKIWSTKPPIQMIVWFFCFQILFYKVLSVIIVDFG